MVLSMFASLISPFGGFFASGFKRAIKIKVNLTKNRINEKQIKKVF